jgi:hypothetical protein
MSKRKPDRSRLIAEAKKIDFSEMVAKTKENAKAAKEKKMAEQRAAIEAYNISRQPKKTRGCSGRRRDFGSKYPELDKLYEEMRVALVDGDVDTLETIREQIVYFKETRQVEIEPDDTCDPETLAAIKEKCNATSMV